MTGLFFPFTSFVNERTQLSSSSPGLTSISQIDFNYGNFPNFPKEGQSYALHSEGRFV
jgi:hypothetical protein